MAWDLMFKVWGETLGVEAQGRSDSGSGLSSFERDLTKGIITFLGIL